MLKIFRMYDDVVLPSFATKDSACFDLRAYLKHREFIEFYDSTNTLCKHMCFTSTDPNTKETKLEFLINPGDRVLIPTGIIFDIPVGYSIRLHSRSSIALKTGLTLANNEGVIDSDYVEQTFVMLLNTSKMTVAIRDGDRICQAELVKKQDFEILPTTEKPKIKTDRNGGFGSTGR